MFLGDIILKYRKEMNMSQRDFSKKSNMSHSYIAMLEKNIDARTGKPISPTLETIKNVSLATNIPIDEILKLLNDEQEIVINKEASKFYMTPVYGQISAGQPNWVEDCLEGYLPVDPNLMNIINPEECFFLKVNGESMNKVIRNGAYALVRKQDYVEDGEIAVVLVNGDNATIKKFTRQGDFVFLEPMSTDDSFQRQIYDNTVPIKILGKYIGKFEIN